jgi:hypothetical protein
MKPELIEFYAALLQEEGHVTYHEDGVLKFESSQHNFSLRAYSKLKYLISHELIEYDVGGAEGYPRILDAVNLSNIMNPDVRAVAIDSSVALDAWGETEPSMGLLSLESIIDRIIETAHELSANISNINFFHTLKK